ncbi:HAD family hydrolase [Saccharibacillus sacchari]|uniref:Haloacid dehalogenase superfamily enzyme, subfamily IA n=1 Tax=Saccharibacillus sacchari DSM 19268 TaxID=915437 RepID=A0A010ZX97_9BACL|nr:HAD-IA family hydrolase [Saccharibacillus sacchari]EXG83249.1 haloacid dehalogenase superfamily enzyme, subfamily IA [Saccharibacillus sacchari DSM 19268]
MNLERAKPQLVFDVGGVLAENLDDFWSGMAQAGGIEKADLRARYKAEIGAALWRGSVTEENFWLWLGEACPAVKASEARALLDKVLLPLPALGLLKDWSERADIHILSNHVAGWILPLFAGIEDCLSSIVVSSEVGYEKPDPRLFAWAATKLKSSDVCFVDDKESNLEVARNLGWDTVLADPEGHWIQEIEHRLNR